MNSEQQQPLPQGAARLTDWLSGSHLRGLADQVSDVARHVGRNLAGPEEGWSIETHVLAEIIDTPASESAAGPAQYWARLAQPKFDLAEGAKLEIEQDVHHDETARTVKVTNLAELAAGTRLLAIGDPIEVFTVVIQKDTPVAHYYTVAVPRGVAIAVKVTKDGGAQGSKTAKATWTYTVKTLDGAITLGTAVGLTRPRPYGRMEYQADNSYGLAFYDGATLKLWDAGEVPLTGACPNP